MRHPSNCSHPIIVILAAVSKELHIRWHCSSLSVWSTTHGSEKKACYFSLLVCLSVPMIDHQLQQVEPKEQKIRQIVVFDQSAAALTPILEKVSFCHKLVKFYLCKEIVRMTLWNKCLEQNDNNRKTRKEPSWTCWHWHDFLTVTSI